MDIRRLVKTKYQGYRVWTSYQTETILDVTREGDSFIIRLKTLESPVGYDLPLTLFEDWYQHAQAFGLFDQNVLVGFVEGYPESWNGSYRITNLFVDSRYRRRGWATHLIDTAKEQAKKNHARQIILESQNTNMDAIAFYKHYGFRIVGLNTKEYQHEKAHKEQIRFEFAMDI